MALCGFLVTSTLSTPTHLDFAAAAEEVNVGQARAPKLAPVQVPLGEPAPPTVAFFGDSTGLITAKGFKEWAAGVTDVQMVPGAAWYGCGIVREGRARFNGKEFDPGACGNLVEQWGQALDLVHPAVGVIQVGPIEVDDHLLPGDGVWRAPGDPVYDAVLKAGMLEAVDLFLTRGVTPIWLTSPRIDPSRSTQPPNQDPSGDPARMVAVQPAAPPGAARATGAPRSSISPAGSGCDRAASSTLSCGPTACTSPKRRPPTSSHRGSLRDRARATRRVHRSLAEATASGLQPPEDQLLRSGAEQPSVRRPHGTTAGSQPARGGRREPIEQEVLGAFR